MAENKQPVELKVHGKTALSCDPSLLLEGVLEVATTPKTFKDVLGYELNDMQKEIIELVSAVGSPLLSKFNANTKDKKTS